MCKIKDSKRTRCQEIHLIQCATAIEGKEQKILPHEGERVV
jgi:hypothetical protein